MADYMAWSYSRLSDFETCALRFQHKYVLKTIKFVTNKAMEEGKKKHAMLEREVIRAGGGKTSACPEVEHVFPLIKGFVNKYSAVSTEQQLAFDHKMNPTDWFAKDVWFRAIIDVVGRTNVETKLQNQMAAVIDWKTGQYRPTTDQLRLCNLAVMLKYPLVIESTGALVFVDHKKSSPPVTTPRHQLSFLVDEFSDRSEAIQIALQRDSWPATKCFQCRWCEVQDCQYIRR